MSKIKPIIYLAILLIVLLWAMAAKVAHGAEVAQVQYQIKPHYTVPALCNKYIDEIEKYPWDIVTAIKVIKLESGCNPKNHNLKDGHKTCLGSWNLFNVGCVHYKKGEDINDVALNIKKAYKVYQDANNTFCPWTTYVKYLPNNCKKLAKK